MRTKIGLGLLLALGCGALAAVVSVALPQDADDTDTFANTVGLVQGPITTPEPTPTPTPTPAPRVRRSYTPPAAVNALKPAPTNNIDSLPDGPFDPAKKAVDESGNTQSPKEPQSPEEPQG